MKPMSEQKVLKIFEDNKYEIKGVKTFETNDGYAFNLNLYKDKKLLGRVSNGGYGGGNEYDFGDEDITKLEKLYEGYVESQYKLKWSIDLIIDVAMEMQGLMKIVKRGRKTKTYFQVKGLENNECKVLNRTFEPKIKEFLVKKYGEDVVILNER